MIPRQLTSVSEFGLFFRVYRNFTENSFTPNRYEAVFSDYITESSQIEPTEVDIKVFQRWIDIVVKGDEKSHEATTNVACVRVPVSVMVSRIFGDYTKLRVMNRV